MNQTQLISASEGTAARTCVEADPPGATSLAALATVARHYGLPVSPASLRRLAGLGPNPADGVMMMYAAGKCGLDALPLEGEFDDLSGASFPAIVTFRDGTYHVLHGVNPGYATLGDTRAGTVREMRREEFVAQWTGEIYQLAPNHGFGAAKSQLRRLESPVARLALLAGFAPFAWTRVLFLLAALGWVSLPFFAGAVTVLVAGCLVASLWMLAFPKGCSRCGATSTVAGRLPLAAIGAAFYALLTAVTWRVLPYAATGGLLAATGAHLALVAVLVSKKMACYPCLATAALAWTATGLLITRSGLPSALPMALWLVLPLVAFAATLTTVHYAGKLARYESTSVLMGLTAKVLAEPEPQAATVRLIVYTRVNCPICSYFKTVIRPTLEEEFGPLLQVEERDAENLRISVPVFYVAGSQRIALTSVATDEMLPRLGAAVNAALAPEAAAPGCLMLSGFEDVVAAAS